MSIENSFEDNNKNSYGKIYESGDILYCQDISNDPFGALSNNANVGVSSQDNQGNYIF